MLAALRTIAASDGKKISTTTMRALKQRNLIDDSLSLTATGTTRAIAVFPLKTQCSMLGISYAEIEVPVSAKRPESKALRYYRNAGYQGISAEGTPVLLLVKAATLDFVIEHRMQYESAEDCCRTYVEAHLTIHAEHKDELLRLVGKSRTRIIKRNLKRIVGAFDPPGVAEELTVANLTALYKKIGPEKLVEIAAALCEDPYGYRKGWPDLIIWNKTDVRWLEIKTTDKLHASQIDTFRRFGSIVPGKIEVVRVRAVEATSWIRRLTKR